MLTRKLDRRRPLRGDHVLAYLPKPTVSRPSSEIFLRLDAAEADDDGRRPAMAWLRPPALLTAALLLCVVLAGLTGAVLG